MVNMYNHMRITPNQRVVMRTIRRYSDNGSFVGETKMVSTWRMTNTLKSLVRRGFVEKQETATSIPWFREYEYRLTPNGMRVLEAI